MRPLKGCFVTLALAWAALANVSAAQSTNPDKNAIAAVRSLALKIEQCPAAEEVAQFKKQWVKVSWGPPMDVNFDVQKTQSIVAPYEGTITFSIPYSGSEQHKRQHEAQEDKNLRVLFISPVKYTLRVSADSGTKIERMEIKNTFANSWSEYSPVRPERFCWITTAK